MKRQWTAAVVVLAVLGSAATAAAERRFGSKTASGKRATAVATGSVEHPRALFATVSAKPKQRITGNWTVICTKGSAAGSKNGKFTAKTPYRTQLKMKPSKPDSCTVIVAGRLSKRGGRVTVTLLAR